MRFLANENLPGASVTAIRTAGHEIVWVRIAAPGMSDPDVLAWAARDGRILLTFDKDFGELARASTLPQLRRRRQFAGEGNAWRPAGGGPSLPSFTPLAMSEWP